MYTDASKSQAKGGASIIWINIKLLYKLPSTSSIFIAESSKAYN